MEQEKLKVLMVEPQKEPCAVEIPAGLKGLQMAVGGYIEAVYPYEEPVALVCNEEGKLLGLISTVHSGMRMAISMTFWQAHSWLWVWVMKILRLFRMI